MITKTEIVDKKTLINAGSTTVATIDTETADTLTLACDNIELTGTLTNNGQPISGGGSTPGSGTLSVYMNDALQSNEFNANSSSNVDIQLYNIFKVSHQSGNTPTVLPNSFYYLTGSGVTSITLNESTPFITNSYLNEYCGMFTAGASSVTFSSYDSRTITWSTEGEQPSSLTSGDLYMFDVIAWKNNDTFYYYGTIKKFTAN